MAPEHMMLKLLLALGLFFLRHVTTDSNITCIVPSVERGEETNITCNFGDIMKGATDDFVIQHYKKGGEFREILFCFPYNSKLECQQNEPGYYIHTDHGLDNGIFTLTIQNATEDHEGRYKCQVIPSLPDRTESCYFTLKERPEDTTSGDTTAGGTDLKQELTTPMESDEEDTDNQTVFTLAIGLVLGGAGVVVAVVICFLCRKRLCARYRRGREKHACVEAASFTNRDSGDVSTLDEKSNLQLIQQTEKDKEETENQEAQSLIKNEACQSDSLSGETEKSAKSLKNSDKTQSNDAVSQTTLPQAHASQSSSSPAKPVSQSPSDASSDTQNQNQEPKSYSRVKATDSAKHVTSQTNPTSLTSPSQRSEVGSAEGARSTESAASPPTNNSTARKDSSQGYSEQNANHQLYDQALKALQETGAVIIAGPEKCGKTTLGRDLLNHLKQEGYTTETMLHYPAIWSSYVRDPDKKCAFLFDERFKAGDKAVSQNTWTHCFRNLRERQCPLVIIVQTSERKEEDVQAFSFLRNIPVVFAVGEKTKDSASKTITEKEDKPRRGVGNTAVGRSGKVGGTSAGVMIFKGLIDPTEKREEDLVIFNVAENPGEAGDENAVNRILKQIGISDSGLREVTCITRLGEKKNWPPRPIKITVNRLETRQKIVAYAKIFSAKETKMHIRPFTTEEEIENLRATYENEWCYE